MFETRPRVFDGINDAPLAALQYHSAASDKICSRRLCKLTIYFFTAPLTDKYQARPIPNPACKRLTTAIAKSHSPVEIRSGRMNNDIQDSKTVHPLQH